MEYAKLVASANHVAKVDNKIRRHVEVHRALFFNVALKSRSSNKLSDQVQLSFQLLTLLRVMIQHSWHAGSGVAKNSKTQNLPIHSPALLQIPIILERLQDTDVSFVRNRHNFMGHGLATLPKPIQDLPFRLPRMLATHRPPTKQS